MAAILQWRLTGGASNSDPNASLGGTRSTTTLSSTPLNNLFDNVQPGEASAGDTEYRALALFNNGDASATAIKLYISSQTPSPHTVIAVGLDSTTQTVANENTAPSGVTFSEPTSGSPMNINDIAVNSEQRVWFRRTVSAGAGNMANDGFTMVVEYA